MPDAPFSNVMHSASPRLVKAPRSQLTRAQGYGRRLCAVPSMNKRAHPFWSWHQQASSVLGGWRLQDAVDLARDKEDDGVTAVGAQASRQRSRAGSSGDGSSGDGSEAATASLQRPPARLMVSAPRG